MDSRAASGNDPQPGLLASGSVDRTVRLWDPSKGRCVRVLEGHTDIVLEGHTNTVMGLAQLTCGLLASGSWDQTVRLWDPSAGQCVRVLAGHSDDVNCVAQLADESLLASGSDDGTVRLWEHSTGSCVGTLTGHSALVRCLAQLASGELASGSYDCTVRLWVRSTGHRTRARVLSGHGSWVTCLAQLSSGLLASGSDDKTIRLWRPSTGKCVRVLSGHSGCARGLAELPSGELASGSRDMSVRLWHLDSGKCVRQLDGHTWDVMCLAQLAARRAGPLSEKECGAASSGSSPAAGKKRVTASSRSTPEAGPGPASVRSCESCKGLEAQVAALQRQNEALTEERDAFAAENGALKQRGRDLQERCDELETRCREREARCMELDARCKSLEDGCAHLRQRLRIAEIHSAAKVKPGHWIGAVLPQGWTAQPVDRRTLEALRTACAVLRPEELGKGRNAQCYDRPYDSLDLHCAWRIEDQALWTRFNTERELVARQVFSVPEDVRPGFVPSRLHSLSELLPGAPVEQVHETWLLHSTHPKHVLPILEAGLNDRMCVRGAFGAGIYLAEEIEKSDQYATPDPHYEAEGLEDLHARLFRAGGNSHPEGDIFFCFVVRAICGLQLETTGLERGSLCDRATGRQLFENNDRRELVRVPGANPPVRYHSLLCRLGGTITRFQEFLLLDANRTYIEYLLAYRRVQR